MHEETNPTPTADDERDANPQQPDSAATGSETLKDIESSEKVSTGSGLGSESSPLETSSPDPETGGGGGRADGSETGGPM